MELNDLIFLGACSLMTQRIPFADEETVSAIERGAVIQAKRIWKEVLKQDKED